MRLTGATKGESTSGAGGCLCFALFAKSMSRRLFYYFQTHTGVVGKKDKCFVDEQREEEELDLHALWLLRVPHAHEPQPRSDENTGTHPRAGRCPDLTTSKEGVKATHCLYGHAPVPCIQTVQWSRKQRNFSTKSRHISVSLMYFSAPISPKPLFSPFLIHKVSSVLDTHASGVNVYPFTHTS